MKTVGETLRDLATHTMAAAQYVEGLEAKGIIVRSEDDSEYKAMVIYELMDAIDASQKDSKVRLTVTGFGGAFAVSWAHMPEEGDPYEPRVNII